MVWACGECVRNLAKHNFSGYIDRDITRKASDPW